MKYNSVCINMFIELTKINIPMMHKGAKSVH